MPAAEALTPISIFSGAEAASTASLASCLTADNIGFQAGESTNQLDQSLPFINSFSPANLDPTGLTGEIGGFFEDNADWILPIAGGVVGPMFFGQTQLGIKAGHAAAGVVDAKSDQGGLFDLDGKETQNNGQSPTGFPIFGAGEGFLST